MTAPTPAVERAIDAIAEQWAALAASGTAGDPYAFATSFATRALTAALTDPDDPDSLARTLFVLYVLDAGIYSTAEIAVGVWTLSAPSRRARWRAVADGLRMMLTGQGS
jgi:hypothetical protein